MSLRMRKLTGAILLLLLVAVWSLAAMVVAQVIFTQPRPVLMWIYYPLAGLGWVLPAMPLVKWMLKPDAAR
ncbi:MAG: DUF2842 domain-containing protein [Pseudorhodoplanes sp.]|nr:hypothetical protein [Pseudorhodoplanes sp.]MBW7950492.1 DUF2842 domain-containing protein [Pseudorhodoplanes sp.]MCL4712962.1 DUF2842 domain-containing protein [Pseudorhodoplanes sp.]MCQ3943554.1 DUF2842 domain-containing protein [Alphaproteobacteria bacterium]